jgi:hypothetical protein
MQHPDFVPPMTGHTVKIGTIPVFFATIWRRRHLAVPVVVHRTIGG